MRKCYSTETGHSTIGCAKESADNCHPRQYQCKMFKTKIAVVECDWPAATKVFPIDAVQSSALDVTDPENDLKDLHYSSY